MLFDASPRPLAALPGPPVRDTSDASLRRAPGRAPVGSAAMLLTLLVALLLAAPSAAAASPRDPAWRAVGPGNPGSVVALAADPEDGRTLYLATDRGILVSRDAGAGWEMTALPGIRALAVHPRAPRHVVAVTQAQHRRFQLWRSDDRGRTWRPRGEVASPPDVRLEYDVLSLAFDPDDPRVVFVGGVVHDRTRPSVGRPAPASRTAGGVAPETAPGRPQTVAPRPTPGTPALGRLWRSTDGGDTLEELAGPEELAPLDLGATRRGVLYAATARGVFRSDDRGARWQEARGGLEAGPGEDYRPVHRLAVPEPAGADSPHRPEVLYAAAGGPHATLFRSTDGGDRWAAVARVPPGPVVALALDPRDRRSLFASVTGEGVHGTRGGTWDAVRPPLPEDGVAVDLALLGDTLYAATADGEVFRRGAPTPPCVDDATTLCLRDRFRVELEWWTGDGRHGSGQAAPLTRDAGWFWIHDREAPEVTVKVVEGGGPDQPWRVHHSALSEVGLDLRVFDVVTGHFQVHRRSPGDLAGDAAGTMTFPPAPEDAMGTDALWFASLPEGGCGGDSIDLCLAGGRFEVVVDWRDGEGGEGAAVADRLSPAAGWFRFFQPGKPDLFVKLVDGRDVNGHWWMYFGALTDAAFTVRVTDRETGEERVYEVPAGEPMAHGDRRAFDTVPRDG